MSLVDYRRPLRSLVLFGTATVLLGIVFIAWGLSQGGGPSERVLGVIVGGALVLLGCYFFFGAWYFAVGRASASDVDPNFRPPKFWERWPSYKSAGDRGGR